GVVLCDQGSCCSWQHVHSKCWRKRCSCDARQGDRLFFCSCCFTRVSRSTGHHHKRLHPGKLQRDWGVPDRHKHGGNRLEQRGSDSHWNQHLCCFCAHNSREAGWHPFHIERVDIF